MFNSFMDMNVLHAKLQSLESMHQQNESKHQRLKYNTREQSYIRQIIQHTFFLEIMSSF